MPRFPPEFIDELKSRLRPSDVIGRYVKLQKRGSAWWGLSPFKKEKTPSFTVNDQRGSFHCFSTQKHGDVISFLTETQGLTFQEAVTSLAQEAGLPIPEDDPRGAARTEQRTGLVEACDAAARFYRAMLTRADGRTAYEYLRNRSVSDEQIDAFEIGYAPGSRTALKDHLINKGFGEAVLVEAGLVIRPDDGGAAFDRFRHRVMFPIKSRQGVIAFGGRALDPAARAKYLNSPESPIFHKSNVLYNFEAARTACHNDKSPLIVCEGYMDVVALWGAGFKAATAPLGTALTEAQLAMLWRCCDAPILCFDGDQAGTDAAFRSVDRAMPALSPGKSLSFVFLPAGEDPDDVVRERGAAAFQGALEASDPLVEVAWRREIEKRDLSTPEQRAALRADLRRAVATIADKDVRAAYGAEFARRIDALFAFKPRSDGRQFRGAAAQKGRHARGPHAMAGVRPTADLRRRGPPSDFFREATLLLAALRHPALVERCEAEFVDLTFADAALARLHSAILDAILLDPGLDSAGVNAHLQSTQSAGVMEQISQDESLNTQKFLRPDAEMNEVERGWRDALRLHRFATGAAKDMSETALNSYGEGEGVWKAAVTAREELINVSGASGHVDEDADVSQEDFTDRLERMRASLKAKKAR